MAENVFDGLAKKIRILGWKRKSWLNFGKLMAEKLLRNWKSFSTREHFILNALAPSLKHYEAEELPISVKPDKQVSVTDVMALLRETYEGTPLDMTQNLKVTVKIEKPEK